MSLILAIYSKTPIEKLKTARPAWAEERLKGGFAYYREDQNTPWLRLDGAGRFSSFSSIRGLVSALDQERIIRISLILLKNRESMKDAVQRGFDLPMVKSGEDFTTDTAITVDLLGG